MADPHTLTLYSVICQRKCIGFHSNGDLTVFLPIKPHLLWDTLRLELRDRREMATRTGERVPDTQGSRGPAPSTPQSASREESSSKQP